MKRTVVCVLVGLVAFASAGMAWAQATAQISGSVKDQTGAVLPGVEITVTQTATGGKRTAVTMKPATMSSRACLSDPIC